MGAAPPRPESRQRPPEAQETFMSKNRKPALPLGQTRPVIADVRAYIEPILKPCKERRTRTEAEKQAAMIERLIKLFGGTKSQAWPWPGHALIWDVETNGFEHKARYGAYELIGTPILQLKAMIEAGFSDEELRSVIRRSVERGLFYDPDRCQPAEIETMQRFVEECKLPLRLRTLQEFKNEVFYRRHDGERKGLNMPTLLVGHNPPFDFGAIAIHSYPSRGRDFGALASYSFCSPREPADTMRPPAPNCQAGTSRCPRYSSRYKPSYLAD